MATVNTYYFDAHNGTSDPGSAWTNDANAFDGNTATLASNSGTSGSASSNYLEGSGTTASSIFGTILGVRVRFYMNQTVGGMGAAFSTDSFATQLNSNPVTTPIVQATGYTGYYTVEKPSAGWSPADIQNMKVRVWDTSITSSNLYKIEIEVTTSSASYVYPTMVSTTAALAASAATKGISVQAASDQSWAGGSAVPTIVPTTTYYQSYNTVITTAPGVGVTRNFAFTLNGNATLLVNAISGTNTSATDTTHTVTAYPGDTVEIAQTVSGGTPAVGDPAEYRLKKVSEAQALMSTSNGTASTTLTRYFGIQSTGGIATTSAAATQTMNESGTLSTFYYAISGTSLSTGNYTLTLYKNGSATAAVYTVTSTTVTADTSTSVSYVAGDYFWWQIDPSTPTAPNAAKVIMASCVNTPSTAGNFSLFSSSNANFGTTGPKYNNWYGDGVWNATETNVQTTAYAWTLTALRADLGVDTGAAKSRVVTFRKNAAGTSATVTFNNTGTSKTWSGSVALADGDGVDVEATAVGAPTTTPLKYVLIGGASAAPKNAGITQVAANVTATGGTQVPAVSGGTVNATVTQVAASATAAGGTQVVSATVIASASITQVAASVTATGGTQTVLVTYTFGTTNSTSVTTGGLTEIAGTKYTLTQSGTVLYIYFYSPNNGNAIGAIYSDVAGVPTTLLVSDSNVPTAITGGQFNRIELPDTHLAAGDYWLTFMTSANNMRAYKAAVPGSNQTAYNLSTVYNNTWPSSFPTPTYQDNDYPAYAVYVADTGVVNASVTQVAANVTAAGGTQTVSATIIASASVTQVAAAVTATGGTQVVTTTRLVSITQLAANVTATGGTQVVTTSRFVAITQLAATVTATGGTQVITTSRLVAITQVAANVTATGGTQVLSTTAGNASVTQVAATITATGGTQTIASALSVSITQLAATVTAAGGTQVVAAIQNVAITQIAANITATGGVQVVTSSQLASVVQLAATLTVTGGTQVVTTVRIVAISQIAGVITATGGSQTVIAVTSASVTQVAANIVATGGTQVVVAKQLGSVAQVAANITATGGTQSIATINNVNIAQIKAMLVVTGGTQVPLIRTGHLNYWNGSTWVSVPVNVWNGSTWVAKPLKKREATAWVNTI